MLSLLGLPIKGVFAGFKFCSCLTVEVGYCIHQVVFSLFMRYLYFLNDQNVLFDGGHCLDWLEKERWNKIAWVLLYVNGTMELWNIFMNIKTEEGEVRGGRKSASPLYGAVASS